jgi:formylglycine-generating enzyme required for sulfatase activity
MKGFAPALAVSLVLAGLVGPGRPAHTATAASRPAPAHAPRVFRDCPDCPEMVVVPGGRFVMGSPPEEKLWAATRGATAESVSDEAPQHAVTLRSFAIGRYDVTRGQYAAFVRETGYPAGDGCGPNGEKGIKDPGVTWREPGFAQTDRDPVVCVSWRDAQAYLDWLNRKAGRGGAAGGKGRYRLPSEAEWEYAARGGTTTRFWWGNDEAGAATHAWHGVRAGRPPLAGNSGGRTHPVGAMPANPFGLYDMAGNVWQWTADCYAETYAAAPADGSPAESGPTCLRVDRGGSWLYAAWLLRSATRERNPPDFRDSIMGFRVARSLP